MNSKVLLQLAFSLVVIILLAAGCDGGQIEPTLTPISGPPESSPTSIPPTSTPIPPTPTEPYLYLDDDFSHATSGWVVSGTDEGAAVYIDGRFEIIVSEPGVMVWSNRNLSLTDFTFEVDAGLRLSSADTMNQLMNIYGVIFRYEDRDNFYFFGINGLGQYFVFKVEAGDATFLQSGDFTNFGDTNRIRIVAEGV